MFDSWSQEVEEHTGKY
jgi:hypothetical protein